MEVNKYKEIFDNLFKLLDDFIEDCNNDEREILELRNALKDRVDICDQTLWIMDTYQDEDEKK